MKGYTETGRATFPGTLRSLPRTKNMEFISLTQKKELRDIVNVGAVNMGGGVEGNCFVVSMKSKHLLT